MDFRAATDALFSCGVTVAKIAEEAGVSAGSILRARMNSGQRRSPPKDWTRVLRAVALEEAEVTVVKAHARAAALSALAAELADA